MSWHLAPALTTLRNQLDGAYPNRSRKSDGTLGDARHQREKSDHNPDGDGSVNAFDVTHGPYWRVRDIDGRVLADQLVASGDRRIKYVIFQRRIWQPGIGWSGYGGVSPHLEHVHLSVQRDRSLENNAGPWRLPMLGYGTSQTPKPAASASPPAATPTTTTPDQETDPMRFLNNNYRGGVSLFVLGDTLREVPCTGHSLGEYGRGGVPSLNLTQSEINDVLAAYGIAAR